MRMVRPRGTNDEAPAASAVWAVVLWIAAEGPSQKGPGFFVSADPVALQQEAWLSLYRLPEQTAKAIHRWHRSCAKWAV